MKGGEVEKKPIKPNTVIRKLAERKQQIIQTEKQQNHRLAKISQQ